MNNFEVIQDRQKPESSRAALDESAINRHIRFDRIHLFHAIQSDRLRRFYRNLALLVRLYEYYSSAMIV